MPRQYQRGELHPKRIALLHVAKKQLSMSDDDYRALLNRVAGVNSSTLLTAEAFERLMLELKRLGFTSSSASKQFGQRPGMASPAQIALMRQLWRRYYKDDDRNEVALNRWLFKFHGVSALRFIDEKKANAVLVALKRMASDRSR